MGGKGEGACLGSYGHVARIYIAPIETCERKQDMRNSIASTRGREKHPGFSPSMRHADAFLQAGCGPRQPTSRKMLEIAIRMPS